MNNAVRHRAVLAVLLLAHALLAGAYSIWNPLAEAPDEADHVAYIRYLAANRQLPTGPRVTQSKHPPLYHATATVLASIGDPLDYQFLRANPDVSLEPTAYWSPNFFIHTTLEDWPWRDGPLAFHMARLWSVLLSTLTVLATYAAVRTGFPSRPGLALAAAGVLTFIPEFAFIGGAVNNDSGAALLGALTIWGSLALYRHCGEWQAGWWTPAAMGFGLLVKISTLALWPVVMLAIVMGVSRTRPTDSADTLPWAYGAAQRWRKWALTCLAFLAVALVIASPWLIRNWRLYGDLLGYGLTQQTVDLRTDPWTFADTIWLMSGWFKSFWGKFGAAGHIPLPSWVYATLAVVSAVALAGLLRAWRKGPADTRAMLFLLAVSVLAVAFGIWRYSLIALGTDQGRLLYPAVSAIAILLVVGLTAAIPERWRTRAALVGLLGLAVLGVYGLAGIIRPAFAPPAHAIAETSPYTAEDQLVRFGELVLLDATLSPEPTLRWYAAHDLDEDLRTSLRVVTQDGTLVWEWRRSPGYGRLSTDRWRAGTVLDDTYFIQWPEWAGAGLYGVEVAVQPYGGDSLVATVDGQPVTSPARPHYFLGWLERE